MKVTSNFKRGIPELILALDVDTLDQAKYFVDKLYPKIRIFKVGSQLFTAYGPEAVKMVGKKGAKVFLDLKFHDIPRTVFSAVTSGTGIACEPVFVSSVSNSKEIVKESIPFPVFMMTVHTEGDEAMLKESVKGAVEKAKDLNIEKPFIIGVTVLTSESGGEKVKEIVLERARKAKKAGLDGVVCSVHEAAIIRKEFGKDFLIVTPGIRPKNYKTDDQSRVATVQDAINAGSDFLVIGRPILEAKDSLAAAEEYLEDILKARD